METQRQKPENNILQLPAVIFAKLSDRIETWFGFVKMLQTSGIKKKKKMYLWIDFQSAPTDDTD